MTAARGAGDTAGSSLRAADPASGGPASALGVRPAGPAPRAVAGRPAARHADRRIALVDLLDRLLAGGVVIDGELSLCIADVELVRVSLRALVTAVESGLGGGGR